MKYEEIIKVFNFCIHEGDCKRCSISSECSEDFLYLDELVLGALVNLYGTAMTKSKPISHGTVRVQTNFDRIKAMSVEKMAEFISYFADGYHTPNQNKNRRKDMKKWLESEVSDNEYI